MAALSAAATSSSARAADYTADDSGEVEAIQNRTYHMAQEFEFSLSILPYDAFYKAVAPEFAYTVHFNDNIAWEAVRVGYAFDFDTNLKTQLLNLGTKPNFFEEVQYFLTSDVVWSPFYFKAAAFNRYVLYGEFYGVLGGGAFNTTQAWRPAPNVGVGGRLFVSQVVSLKLDVREHLLIESNLPSVVDVNFGFAINLGSGE